MDLFSYGLLSIGGTEHLSLTKRAPLFKQRLFVIHFYSSGPGMDEIVPVR